MARTAFDLALGLRQGRLAPQGHAPAFGSHAFVLGSDIPGELFRLDPGDFVGVHQALDVTNEQLIRARLHMRFAPTPPSMKWEVALTVDGNPATTVQLKASRTRHDLAANVSKLSGTVTVGIRLSLVTT